MAKILVIRRGSKRSVSIDERVGHALVKGGGFSYVEVAKVSKSKRRVKRSDAPSRAVASEKPQAVKVENPPAEAKTEETTTRPMTSARVAVKPMVHPKKPVMSKDDLHDMTKADLKVLGIKMGVNLLPSDSKDTFVDKIYRYMRRDMRAER